MAPASMLGGPLRSSACCASASALEAAPTYCADLCPPPFLACYAPSELGWAEVGGAGSAETHAFPSLQHLLAR